MNIIPLQLHLPSSVTGASSKIGLLPSLPPPDDQPVSYDEKLDPVSLYGDDTWDLRAVGWRPIHFDKDGLSPINKELVKRLCAVVLFHPKYFPGKFHGCYRYFRVIKRLAKVCERHGISLSEFKRFPQIHEEAVSELSTETCGHTSTILKKILSAHDLIGFKPFDYKFVILFEACNDEQMAVQHPYIPPRIWEYSVGRLLELIDEFLLNKDQIENAHAALVTGYWKQKKDTQASFRKMYGDTYGEILEHFSLSTLMVKWMGEHVLQKNIQRGYQKLGMYMGVVRDASLVYIGYYSMQRKTEIASLMADCFKTEIDPKIGKICMLIGETTKTIADSDARWVVPDCVEKAVNAATVVGEMRLTFATDQERKILIKDDVTKLLVHSFTLANNRRPNHEAYAEETSSNHHFGFKRLIQSCPQLLSDKEITITKEDWKIALALTPNLAEKKEFGLGKPWSFTLHQLRRTLAVNVQTSGMVSTDSLQCQMQHSKVDMSLYYARGHTNLRMNKEASKFYVVEGYRAATRQFSESVISNTRFLNPHPKETVQPHVLNLIKNKDLMKVQKLIEAGNLSCRRTQVGVCMSNDDCKYGGIESIIHCTGADGAGICQDARFDRMKRPQLVKLKETREHELSSVKKDDLRAGMLRKEIYGIEVYLNATR